MRPESETPAWVGLNLQPGLGKSDVCLQRNYFWPPLKEDIFPALKKMKFCAHLLAEEMHNFAHIFPQ